MMAEPSGHSHEQEEAEEWLIGALSQKLGLSLTKKRFHIDDGGWLEIDGYCGSPLVLCEAWAHVGTPRSAQKHKVMTDAFKLLWLSAANKDAGQRILLFGDQEAASHFERGSWMAQSLKKCGIVVEVVEMPLELKIRVLEAQERQHR